MENSLFFETITQPKGNVYITPIILIIVLLVVIGLMIGIIFTIKNTNISIKDREIRINSFIYGRKISIEDVLVNEVQTINLKQNDEYNISVRTNGIGLPNFSSGWMKLKNGKKALVYLTNRENVLLIPTKNFEVLFSMERTNEFIDKIKEIK
jgi:uncharacterized protein YneF (UPF0154 family)